MTNLPHPRCTAGAAALTALIGLALWSTRSVAAGRGYDPTEPLPPEYLDQGVACLAEGDVQPGLGELSERELRTVAGILGRLLHAYCAGAFGSFLALRADDLEFAVAARADDLEALRALTGAFPRPAPAAQGDWIETLGDFWRGYYERPPVARFLFERARIALHREGLGSRSLEAWERSFEALRDREPGAWILHELTVPHRRPIERVAGDAGPLQWLDLDLAFESSSGGSGRLVTRFVWDGVLESWYLHAAVTVYANGDRSERHLIL